MKYVKRLLAAPFVFAIFLVVRFFNCIDTVLLFLKNGGDLNVNIIPKEDIKLHGLDNFTRVDDETMQLLNNWGYYFLDESRPSLYKVQDWLRIKFNIHSTVSYWENDDKYYFLSIKKSDEEFDFESEAIYTTYEEALQASIKHVIKHTEIIPW